MTNNKTSTTMNRFLAAQITDYGNMIYIGDKVKTNDGKEGIVKWADYSGGDEPGYNDLNYLLDTTPVKYYSRLDLTRISQTPENKTLEAMLNEASDVFDKGMGRLGTRGRLRNWTSGLGPLD